MAIEKDAWLVAIPAALALIGVIGNIIGGYWTTSKTARTNQMNTERTILSEDQRDFLERMEKRLSSAEARADSAEARATSAEARAVAAELRAGKAETELVIAMREITALTERVRSLESNR